MQVKKLIKEIFDGNLHFVSQNDEDFFKGHATNQQAEITLLTCSDARVQTDLFMDKCINRVFTVRNIGNQFCNSVGSIDFGIYYLQTKVLLIIGHSDCNAIQIFYQGLANETLKLQEELAGLAECIGKYSYLSFQETVEKNVDSQVEAALKRYQVLVASGNLTILGCVYDFDNTYGNGYGKLYLINVNGESDTDLIANKEVLSQLPSSLRENCIKRLT